MYLNINIKHYISYDLSSTNTSTSRAATQTYYYGYGRPASRTVERPPPPGYCAALAWVGSLNNAPKPLYADAGDRIGRDSTGTTTSTCYYGYGRPASRTVERPPPPGYCAALAWVGSLNHAPKPLYADAGDRIGRDSVVLGTVQATTSGSQQLQ
ncbi:hypothetical protein BCR33DRAFT_762349 [Rhizoclosmatium globosum]|uniref:Uncharacterized protein n=1 Tax=Rhizoclosmatium globosum TaxID=329046 RepID=A0A1Y2CUH1_9FUNG|nr:hypothetical protein BCR33DRAFT_762349 [Rhizoclosmatium globosum]|eukprot:ORY50710.1 hypothetical protein BCR33DRAFT_762349 [Rhizoclosmatium globosum]